MIIIYSYDKYKKLCHFLKKTPISIEEINGKISTEQKLIKRLTESNSLEEYKILRFEI